jgi:hypothetical protein
MSSGNGVRLGSQTPRIEHVPTYVTTAGDEAIELAAMAGLVLDPFQCRVERGALGQDATGHWTASEVGLVMARQNGKGSIVEAAALHALYLRRSKIVYTAHLMATSRKIRERIQYLIEGVPDLDKEVKQIRVANEEQSIALKPPPVVITDSGPATRAEAARMDFVARTGASARGWAGYDLIFFDEAFALTAAMVGALMPIMFARANWQLWYVSMAGMVNSDALRAVRQRGLNGDDDLAYFEWSVDEEIYRANPEKVARDPAALAQSNPALGGRITLPTLLRAQRSMDPIEFAREVLCVWDDPGGEALITAGQWTRLIDPFSTISSGVVFAFDVAPGLTSGAIGVSGYRQDGIPHVEITSRDGVLDHRPGVEWMVARIVELEAEHQPVAWIMDGSGPARALLTDLQAAGIEPVRLLGKELAQASGAFLAAATAPTGDRLRHLGQEVTADAIRAARKRDVVDDWVFSRKTSLSDITPLMVIAEALHGLAVHDVAIYDILESIR